MVSPLVLPQPAAVGDEWGNSLNVAVQAVNADVEALKVRSIAAGLGLTGGGDLTQNRSFAVDFAASGVVSATKAVRADDKRLNAYVITADTHAPTARPEAYPVGFSAMDTTAATWPVQYGVVLTKFINVNRAAQQYISKTGARTWTRAADNALTDGWTPWVENSLVGHVHTIANVTSLQTTLDAKALATRLITAGSGLTGGGNLTADRTLAVDLATVAPLADDGGAVIGVSTKSARQDHVHPRSDTGWIIVGALTNGWVNKAGADPNARYRKIDGIVHIHVHLGDGTIGASAFQLPAGYRPSNSVVHQGPEGPFVVSPAGFVSPYVTTNTTARAYIMYAADL